jgi:hypothetical protein
LPKIEAAGALAASFPAGAGQIWLLARQLTLLAIRYFFQNADEPRRLLVRDGKFHLLL